MRCSAASLRYLDMRTDSLIAYSSSSVRTRVLYAYGKFHFLSLFCLMKVNDVCNDWQTEQVVETNTLQPCYNARSGSQANEHYEHYNEVSVITKCTF